MRALTRPLATIAIIVHSFRRDIRLIFRSLAPSSSGINNKETFLLPPFLSLSIFSFVNHTFESYNVEMKNTYYRVTRHD